MVQDRACFVRIYMKSFLAKALSARGKATTFVEHTWQVSFLIRASICQSNSQNVLSIEGQFQTERAAMPGVGHGEVQVSTKSSVSLST
jgi:hypothetical protein